MNCSHKFRDVSGKVKIPVILSDEEEIESLFALEKSGDLAKKLLNKYGLPSEEKFGKGDIHYIVQEELKSLMREVEARIIFPYEGGLTSSSNCCTKLHDKIQGDLRTWFNKLNEEVRKR